MLLSLCGPVDARPPLGEPPGRLFGRTVAVYGLFFGVSMWKKPSDIAPSEAENKWITLAVAANANHPVSRAELTQPAATLITTSIKDKKTRRPRGGRDRGHGSNRAPTVPKDAIFLQESRKKALTASRRRWVQVTSAPCPPEYQLLE